MLFTPHRSGGPISNIQQYYQALVAENRPIPVMSVGDYGVIKEVYNNFPGHKIISAYRPLDSRLDAPDYNSTPASAAASYLEVLRTKIPSEFNKDTYLVLFNEVDKNRAEFLAEVASLIAVALKTEGYKSLWFNWSGGEPERKHWSGNMMLNFLDLCERSEGMIGVGLHEYASIHEDSDGTLTGPTPWLIGRHTWLGEVCNNYGIDYSKIPVAITEFGYGQDPASIPDDKDRVYNECLQVHNTWYAGFDNILFLSFWAVHSGSSAPFYGAQLSAEIEQIFNKFIPNIAAFDLGGVPVEPPPVSSPALVAWIPEQFTDAEINWVNNKARNGFTKEELGIDIELKLGVWGWSHRDLINVILEHADNPRTRLVVLNPHKIGTGVTKEWLDEYMVGLGDITKFFYTEAQRVILTVPFRSQIGIGATLRNDCGPACMSMVVNYYHGEDYAPDYISNLIGKYNDSLVSMQQVMDGFNKLGVLPTYKRPLTFETIKTEIDAKRPIVALVDYSVLPLQYKKDVNYAGWHYVVVIGYDQGGVLFHDPLSTTDNPTYVSLNVWDSFNKGTGLNQPYQAILTNKKAFIPPTVTEWNEGLHMNASGGNFTEAEIDLVTKVNFNSLKVLSSSSPQSLSRLSHIKHWIIRPWLSMENRVINPHQFFNDTIIDIQRTINSVSGEIILELHNEPNLRLEGLYSSWFNGVEFRNWLATLLQLYKAVLPSRVKYAFPAMSPGPSYPNFKIDDFVFLNDCKPIMNQFDYQAVHVYWSNPDYPLVGSSLDKRSGFSYLQYLITQATLPVLVTEYSNNKPYSAELKANEYMQFRNFCKNNSRVAGIYSFVSTGHPDTFPYEKWIELGLGDYYVASN